jgi:putative endonuclease
MQYDPAMSFYVYIVTNKPGGVLYTGHTDCIENRAWEHRTHYRKGFTDKYNCERLVWYEIHHERDSAFLREKRIKRWRRQWKIELIEKENPEWEDLFPHLFG